MKIVIVTQNAPMYLAEFLDNFISSLAARGQGIELTALVAFTPYARDDFFGEIASRYGYYGLRDFLIMSWHIAVNKIRSRFAAFKKYSKCYSLGNVISKYRLNVLEAGSPNSRQFIDFIKTNNVDVIISIASPKIFKTETLAAPKLFAINYHTGPLPRYRGRQPLFWQLFNNEKQVGITIHEMDEKLDNGPIISQQYLPIDKADSLHSLYLKTTSAGPRLLLDALLKIKASDASRIANDSSPATYFSFPDRNTAEEFRKTKRFF